MLNAILLTTLLWGLGLGLYWSLLRDTAPHAFNRAYLLGVVVIGMLAPWLPSPQTSLAGLPSVGGATQVWLTQISVTAEHTGFRWFDLATLLTGLYLAGVLVTLGLVLREVVTLVKCFGESRPVTTDVATGMHVRTSPVTDSPFSYGKTLFVRAWDSLDRTARAGLLAHEVAHWRLGHRFDNAVMSLVRVAAWFHPLIYVLHRELRLVHEFQADRATLAEVATRPYQRLLLNYRLNPLHATPHLAAAFAHEPLKNRFDMMHRTYLKTQVWRLGLAALTFATVTVACTKEPNVVEELAELRSAADEGLSADEQMQDLTDRVNAGEYTMSSDTIEVFDPATYESTVTVVLNFKDQNGQTVKSFQRSADDSNVASPAPVASRVRNQEVLKIVDEMPHFPSAGCATGDKSCYEKAMLQNIYAEVQYPKADKDAGREGKVIAQFVVGTDGELLEPSIIRSPSESMSAEVLRVIREMPAWVPGKHNGEKVQVSFVLPIQFKLE